MKVDWKFLRKLDFFFTLGERKKWVPLFNHEPERKRKIFQTGERERERGFSGWARAHRFLTSALMLCHSLGFLMKIAHCIDIKILYDYV